MIEGVDYIIEDGLLVFTKEYHLKRGYCCKSACRNCPWAYTNSKQTKNDDLTNDTPNNL